MNLNVRTEIHGMDDQSWLGSAHGTDAARSITLKVSLFTPATHYPNGFFRSGTPLGRVTASGLYGPYDNAAADGREALVGFLLTAVAAPASTTSDVSGAMLDHGRVLEARLPIAVDAPGKTDVAGRIQFI
jgi:Bacteriophage lambda head decoration protein D